MSPEPSRECPTEGCGGVVVWELEQSTGKWFGSCMGECADYHVMLEGKLL